MKKVILFTIISCSLHSISKAQISKGSIFFGGGISINDTKYNNPSGNTQGIKENVLSVTPAIGIAIKENLVAGIKLKYGHSENVYNSSPISLSENETTSYGGGIFLRKYLTLGKGFYVFGDGALEYTKDKTTQNSMNINAPTILSHAEAKGWNLGLGFKPGVSYAVSKKFHLEAGLPNLLSLDYGRSKSSNSGKRTTFGLSSNAGSLSSFSFGFRVLLAK